MLPHKSNPTSAVASATFNPTAAFGIQIDGESSDPTKNSHGGGHRQRLYRSLRSPRQGLGGARSVRRDHPEHLAGRHGLLGHQLRLQRQPLPGQQHEAGDCCRSVRTRTVYRVRRTLQLGFDQAVAGTLADTDGQGTGFKSTQPNKLDTTVGSNSYSATLLDLVTTGSRDAGDHLQRHRNDRNQRQQRQFVGERPAGPVRRARRQVHREHQGARAAGPTGCRQRAGRH